MQNGIKRFIIIIAVVISLAGCVMHSTVEPAKSDDWAQQRQRTLLTGTWYGESQTKDGGKRQEISQHQSDGTFTTRFRVIEPTGHVWFQTEIGFWGVSGGVYFTITKGWLHDKTLQKADPSNASLNDTYRILELTETRFRYHSLSSDDKYSETKVPATFTFPAP